MAWAADVMKRVNSPRVKILCDVYHMQIMDGDIVRNIRDYYPWIGHFHTGGVPGRRELLGYMDTDSFIFIVETEDIYKNIAERPDIFALNRDVTIGKFKDETPGNVITESFYIRAKSYHYILADKTTKSKHKGVSKKGMDEIATDSYMPTLEGSLLNDPIDRSSLSK
jgi:hypothetical protein